MPRRPNPRWAAGSSAPSRREWCCCFLLPPLKTTVTPRARESCAASTSSPAPTHLRSRSRETWRSPLTIAPSRLEKRPPDGLYEIPADHLPSHLRKDIVGDSYLFWLPFQEPSATSVVVQGRFETAKGREVVSSIVSVDLKPTGSVEHTSASAASPSRQPMPKSTDAARNAFRRGPEAGRSRSAANDAVLSAPAIPTEPVATLGRPRQTRAPTRANRAAIVTGRAAN